MADPVPGSGGGTTPVNTPPPPEPEKEVNSTLDSGSAVDGFFQDFFSTKLGGGTNWKTAVSTAALVFADYADVLNKRLAYSLDKLKEANSELRQLAKAQRTIKSFEAKLQKWQAGAEKHNAGQDIKVTDDYKLNPFDTHGKNDATVPSEADRWKYIEYDKDGNAETKYFSEVEIANFQEAIATIKFFSRNAETGDFDPKEGQDNIDEIFGTEADGVNQGNVTLAAVEKALSIVDNQVEALSPLTNRLSQASQTISANVQKATTAVSQWIDVDKITILPFFQK